MSIPSKLQRGSGIQFKPAVVNKINELIDYLNTQRITTDSSFIRKTQTSNGIQLAFNKDKILNQRSESTNHPFRINIGLDDNGKQYLYITPGSIFINGPNSTDEWHIGADAEGELYHYSIDDLTYQKAKQKNPKLGNFTQAYFYVYLMFFYDLYRTRKDASVSPGWTWKIFYSQTNDLGKRFIQGYGGWLWTLGKIKLLTKDNGQKIITVAQQYVMDNRNINYNKDEENLLRIVPLDHKITDRTWIDDKVISGFTYNDYSVAIENTHKRTYNENYFYDPVAEIDTMLLWVKPGQPISGFYQIDPILQPLSSYLSAYLHIYINHKLSGTQTYGENPVYDESHDLLFYGESEQDLGKPEISGFQNETSVNQLLYKISAGDISNSNVSIKKCQYDIFDFKNTGTIRTTAFDGNRNFLYNKIALDSPLSSEVIQKIEGGHQTDEQQLKLGISPSALFNMFQFNYPLTGALIDTPSGQIISIGLDITPC